ncbi:hypothetical protein BKI52_06345 [marine bacterium AO1-C]|nr:hypothetical protein BKI52_06345 [marine bacterium AO1-C]
MKLKNYYALLEVLPQASTDEIKKAYRKMAKIWHPDKNNSAQAEDTFQQMHEAYKTLQCPAKRKVYNLKFWKVFGKSIPLKGSTKSKQNDFSGLDILRRNKERLFGKTRQKQATKYEHWVDNDFLPNWKKKMQEAIQHNKIRKTAAWS